MTNAIALSSQASSDLGYQLTTDIIDVGTAAKIAIFTGTLPATNLSATGSDTYLGLFTMADPSAVTWVNGVITFDLTTPLSMTTEDTGTAGYFILYDSAFNPILGGSVGTADAAMIFNSVAWFLGDTVELTAGTVTIPHR